MRREEGELLGWSPDIMLEAKLDEATFSDAEKRQRLIQELASEPDETIDEVRKILRTNAKRWWKVAVQVIRVIGYPCNVVAMSELIEQISDKNSPAWESVICTCLALIICAGCGMFSPGGSAGLLTDFASAMSQFDGHNWSPDGHWLAAESSNIDNFALFSADGHLVNSLDLGCYLGSGVEDIAWLPDGRLSCVVEKRPPMLGIFTLNRSGQVGKKTMIPVPIEPQVVVSAIQWNPHESWLATIAASQVGSIHIPTLYISDLKGHLLF
jgi:hypothetical protein